MLEVVQNSAQNERNFRVDCKKHLTAFPRDIQIFLRQQRQNSSAYLRHRRLFDQSLIKRDVCAAATNNILSRLNIFLTRGEMLWQPQVCIVPQGTPKCALSHLRRAAIAHLMNELFNETGPCIRLLIWRPVYSKPAIGFVTLSDIRIIAMMVHFEAYHLI